MLTEIADIETDGLLPLPPHNKKTMTKLHCLAVKNPDTGDATLYADHPGYPSIEEGVDRLRRADRIVMHNGIKFDCPALVRFGYEDFSDKVFDTLIVWRLVNPGRKNGHSLAEAGRAFDFPKGDIDSFERFTPAMGTYCLRDDDVTEQLYKRLGPIAARYGYAVELEHEVAKILFLQEQNGFRIDVENAQELVGQLRQELEDIKDKLRDSFPPIWVANGYKEPKRTVRYKDPLQADLTAGAPYGKVKLQEFNPGSRPQIADRLIRRYGWKPDKWTNTGQPEVSEEVLKRLTWPEAKLAAEYLDTNKKLGQIVGKDRDKGWLNLEHGGRVHGSVITTGAATGRMSHKYPNMAQVSKDPRMRALWKPREGWKLIGIDADGLELRVMGHFLAMYDEGAFGKRAIEGSAETGDDVHTLNQRSIKLYLRDSAKTIIYAIVYGGGDAKLGREVIADARKAGAKKPHGSPSALGKAAREALMKGITGFDSLSRKTTKKAKRDGWIPGLDGRKIKVRSLHSCLNFLFQGAGAVIMKEALVIFHREMMHRVGPENDIVIGRDWAYCANVHDEFQIEAKPGIAELIGKTASWAIEEAGRSLNLRVPMTGSHDIGDNWSETH
ncbi:hypothetical protein KAJ83_01625 [Marivibrio halodurans]|uniref:DNA polymerase I n=1 Tax=Marivibrio halodurans TaxID=2039722 RepID=A0A8J7RVY9_9PROT|nr:DNA polymerase [Marivibrio halodurans]MBP5855692.1 hypothetical protein [Marivibrio halodurans]